MKLNHQKAWVVAVDMGYGHQRAAAPLKKIAYKKKVINANNYPGIPEKDLKVWKESRRFYEFISRFKKVPLIGQAAFDLFDKFQEIPEFYPKRDLSAPNMQLKYMYHMIEKYKWGEHLIKKMGKKPLPLITTFFVTAFMAEKFDYPGEIFAVVTDTDISRTWVALDPRMSRIKYLAPSTRAVERLKLYGVPDERIFHTGFPLPVENLGSIDLDVLKYDVANRLINLDPNKKYLNRFDESIRIHLGEKNYPRTKSNHKLTLMFAVGGAGAQKEIGIEIIKSLFQTIKSGDLRIYLVAGTHKDIEQYYKSELRKLKMNKYLNKGIRIIHSPAKEDYFKKFNKALKETDILWTKPSELSFYTALGLPIIMAPTIGSQEKFNRNWLFKIGSGVEQENPIYTNEWLYDLLETGWFAEASMQGFLEAPKYGTYNIQKIISAKPEFCLECKTEMKY
ncbi:hypothetical protein A2223_03585 [Candidatus Falkowbacteria bacterium RIFOXYA2_FULL_35_8]|uniref:DUF6938 domain-containing protein n=1 Tax=Candidatus Falkowbacteria bacterium RIFOXYC2_FULL_36_12 TaxID=1798002 RepID=A0A1F5SWL6_9BACT|nr:MAG: hypothetical protein A2478_00450 [Candidatus Falkowbacteria bacterium RIFOXYC2_FULL_36_12]OGF31370.1 MAG: hypothetical protein A2300_01005 [Candidatus Falkowbacteria bacterium RIFOXYB2_FULL_35_7]OGF33607.1 MAG: hypothetical protein A2223_03585 [Candidatus Falkowbacteria bacterium RIFOXYA2_FULL_35_8]